MLQISEWDAPPNRLLSRLDQGISPSARPQGGPNHGRGMPKGVSPPPRTLRANRIIQLGRNRCASGTDDEDDPEGAAASSISSCLDKALTQFVGRGENTVVV